MTLDEIVAERSELERQIHILLSQFESGTGVIVTGVDLNRFEMTRIDSPRPTSQLTRVSLACEVP